MCAVRDTAPQGVPEVGDGNPPGDHEIVIPAEREVAALTGEPHAGVGLRAVAHEVAQAPDLLGALGIHVVEHGLEGRRWPDWPYRYGPDILEH